MNSISATITDIVYEGPLYCIELDAAGIPLGMLLFDLDPSFTRDCKVNVLFKETEATLAKGVPGETSFINSFPATVKEVRRGRILADIRLQSAVGIIDSIITMKAFERLKLKENDSLTVLIKESQLSLDSPLDKRSCTS